jgi:hypothetical protein
LVVYGISSREICLLEAAKFHSQGLFYYHQTDLTIQTTIVLLQILRVLIGSILTEYINIIVLTPGSEPTMQVGLSDDQRQGLENWKNPRVTGQLVLNWLKVKVFFQHLIALTLRVAKFI